MKTLKEVQKLASTPTLENYFKENSLLVQMQAPPDKSRKYSKSKLLVLVNHHLDDKQWFVNTFLISNFSLLMAACDGITIVTRKGQNYIPLPLAEEIIGIKLDNFRAAIARNIQMLKDELMA